MATTDDSPELNKNGTVSRKRLHQGNTPSIPRTEECHVCAAKFTRANHLKRHLLTHTDSRKHECEKCHFHFTRRDILTKHMRICGKPKERKSRRKSCIPCATSKSKCDMKQPCSGCQSRNKECVFLDDELGPSNDTSAQNLALEPNVNLAFPPLLHPQVDRSLFAKSISYHEMASLIRFPSSGSYLHSNTEFPHIPDFTWPASLLNTFQGIEFMWDGPPTKETFPPPFAKPLAHLPFKTTTFVCASLETLGETSETTLPAAMFPFASGDLDMEECLSLCLQRFTVNIPLIHAASWVMEGKSPLLITVMQSCGAIFLKSPAARSFVKFVADSVPDMISFEMDRCPPDLTSQLHLLYAFLFLQSEGIFNIRSHGCDLESTRHAARRMIQRNKLIDQIAAWKHPTMNPLKFSVINEEWRRWGEYESFKRLLWMLYTFDCLSSLYFSTESNFNISAFPVALPCENNVWEARNPMEWFWTLTSEPKYAHFYERLVGASVQDIIAGLLTPSAAILRHNSWHLCCTMIGMTMEIQQSLLDRKEARLSFFYAGYDSSRGVPTKIRFFGELVEFSTVRTMLENWLAAWMHCTEIFDHENNELKQFSCFSDLVHMYYTAHVLLNALEKPTNEFTWTGHDTARSTKTWFSEHMTKRTKSQIVDWDGLWDVRLIDIDEATVPEELREVFPLFKAQLNSAG